jgi:hypothetical protein
VGGTGTIDDRSLRAGAAIKLTRADLNDDRDMDFFGGPALTKGR